MSKTVKVLLITAFCVLVAWAGLSTLYTYSVAEELTTLRREGRSDTVYLRCRIRDLESELAAHREEKPSLSTEPADGEPVTETPADDTTAPLPSDTEVATEEVTVPTHSSPETAPVGGESPSEPSRVSPYLVASHEGIIGLFDASGALLRTANVYIMTLPESDREALTVGIPAGDWAEALEILERYG